MAITTIKPMPQSLLARSIRRALTARHPRMLAALTLPLMLQPLQAADWTFKPGVEVRESYSDNVQLQPIGQEHGDFVTEVIPRFSLTGVGRRVKLKADYALDALFYKNDSRQNNVLQLLNGDVAAELVDDLLYFDGRASITQQNLNTFGAVTTDRINATDNRSEVRTVSLSPYVRHRFGSMAKAEARYSHDIFDVGNDRLSNARSDRLVLKLDNGSAFQALGWGLLYSDQKTHYANTASVDISSYSANLRYAVLPTFAVTATAGHERYGYPAIADDAAGAFGSVGLSWRPSERTMVDASIGRRFYGNTYMLQANHRARRSVWALSYNEDITNTQSQFQNQSSNGTSGFLNRLWTTSIPDAAVRSDAVDSFVRDSGLPSSLASPANALSSQFFLQKSLQASVALNGARNTVVLSAYNTLRTAQSALPVDATLSNAASALDALINSRQTGVQGLWNTRLSPSTNANLSLGYNRVRATTTAREDRTKTARLALNHRFSRKLKGVLEVRRLQQDSSLAGFNVRENAIAASLTTEF